jgi:hypothetical protein
LLLNQGCIKALGFHVRRSEFLCHTSSNPYLGCDMLC